VRPPCGSRALLALILGAASCSLGCGASTAGASLAQLQNRAVFDLGCPGYQLSVYHVDSRTKAVTGCGRRLLYVESCQDIRGAQACTWVMNTPTFVQTQWPGLLTPQPTTVVVQQQLPAPSLRPHATSLFDPGARAPTAVPPQPGSRGGTVPSAGAKPGAGAGAGAEAGRGTTLGEPEGRSYSTDLFGTTPGPGQPTPPEDAPDDAGSKDKPRSGKRISTDLFDDRR
jgi:hypothetical protein